MRYCARCLYPENAKPTIIIDEEGVCSGCRYHESRAHVNWEERGEIFWQIVHEAKRLAKERGNLYDCIIPVSGGKDSNFQVYTLKKIYGLTPLLVTFNHIYNSQVGVRNLENLVDKSGSDLLRFTANPHSVRKVSRFMLKTVGDLTWHYHAGIFTFPFRVAVERNIPFVMLGEEGYSELTGMFTIDDFVEFKKWTRKEHDMRGYEPEDVVAKSKGEIAMTDLIPYIFPSEEDIERVGVRGIYMSNFFDWDAKYQAELVMGKWNFAPVTFKRDRTFNLFAKTDDHANDIHDYLKFLKFGYGRATDDASIEIRHGRMTREEGIQMVTEYDANEPETLKNYLDFLEITKAEFYGLVEDMRDPSIWVKGDGEWHMKDSVANHSTGELVEKARVEQIDDRVFSEKNRNLYFNDKLTPIKRGDPRSDEKILQFKIL
jgi:N-acetyl sugar amidotransferase